MALRRCINYVELIFRSKRLFIVSIILASAGDDRVLPVPRQVLQRAYDRADDRLGSRWVAPDDSRAGHDSLQDWMSSTRMVRDPNFIKQAMREANLGSAGRNRTGIRRILQSR